MKNKMKFTHLLFNTSTKNYSSHRKPFLNLSNFTFKRAAAIFRLLYLSFISMVIKPSSKVLIGIVLFTIFLLPFKGQSQTGKTFVVNNTSDSADADSNDGACDIDLNQPGNQCSFRAAIQNHNDNRNLDHNYINFDISNATGSGSIVIKVGSTGLGPLPPVLGSAGIYAVNSTSSRRIELDGSQAGSNAIGLQLLGGTCQISFFVINSFSSHGIFIAGTPPPGEGKHHLESNRIGTDSTGTVDKGNGGDGIFIDNTAGNVIGGIGGRRNIISGNEGYGIRIVGGDPAVTFRPNSAKDNLVEANVIGLDLYEEKVLTNTQGAILLEDAPDNTVGGVTEQQGNKIGGVNNGITIKGSFSEGIKILGNFIGLDGTGAKFSAGIFSRGGKLLSVEGNFITNIADVGIDLFLDATGGYNIRKNRFDGDMKIGSKFRFGPGRLVDITYENNFHFDNGLAFDAVETLNSTINWLVAGDVISAGKAGANIVFNAAGNKNFTNNQWVGSAGIGFNYQADIAPGVLAAIYMNGELYANNAQDGRKGIFKVAGVLSHTISGSNNNYNGSNGATLEVYADATASFILTSNGNHFVGNIGGGFRLVSDGQYVPLIRVFMEQDFYDNNRTFGIELLSTGANRSITNNTITNNTGPGISLIGTSIAHIEGNNISGNGTGIFIADASTASVNNNTISGNSKGIVSTSSGGSTMLAANSIFNNTVLGIDLGNDGVTINDNGDADVGPNNFQNFPVIATANSSGGNTNIQGSLNSIPNSNFRVDLFSNNTCTASGFGEGQTFLDSIHITTDANGNAIFSTDLVGITLPAGAVITATATDDFNNTSEFGPCFSTGGTPILSDLELTKQADKTQATVGDQVTFTLTLINKGPANATGISITDILPASINFLQATTSTGNYDNNNGIWTVGALASGSQTTLTITGTITQSGIITNTAEVTASNQTDPDSSPGNGVATEDDQSSFSINAVQISIADLELTKQADKTQATIGDQVSFKLTLINKGPAEATGIAITDILPAGINFLQAVTSTGSYNNSNGIWTVNALASGSQATINITSTLTQAGIITNTAEVTVSDQTDPDSSPDNGVATEDDQSSVSINVVQISIADLELTKQADKSQATVGDQVSFKLTLINKGPAEATGIAITDILPAGISFLQAITSTGSYNNSNGIWTVNALASGSQATLTIVSTTNQPGSITNTAEVTASNQTDPDSSPGNGVATEDDISSASVQVTAVITGTVKDDIIKLMAQVTTLVNEGELTIRQGKNLNKYLSKALEEIDKGINNNQIVKGNINAIRELTYFIIEVKILMFRRELSKKNGQMLISSAINIIKQLLKEINQLYDHKNREPELTYKSINSGVDSLYANYPNPFSNSTVISFELAKQGRVLLNIYDPNGRMIMSLLDKVMPAGKHHISWQPKNLETGVYFLRIKKDNFIKTQSMVLIK